MNKRRKGVLCTAAVMGVSMLCGSAAMAHESAIALPCQEDAAWDEIALTNDDTVNTGVNVRSAADEDSSVIGCLYHGGAAWVIDRGEEWTEIYSGGLTGFVKNEYLVSGEDAKALAQSYGVEGVATTWNDVKLYSGADGGSEVLDSLTYGDSFILTQDEGHWLQVQRGADSTAYVSSEDVSRVLLLDTAVATDEAYLDESCTDGAADAAYADESYTDTTSADTAYTDESYTDTTSADAAYTDGSYTDTTYTDAAYTDATSADTAYTDESYTDTTYTDGSYTDTTYMDESYTNTTGADTAYTDTTYTDGSYTDTTYTDESYTNESYTDTTSADASYTDVAYTDTSSADATAYAASADTTGTADAGVTPGTGTESYYDPATGIYYDASTGLYYDSGTGILYDAWWNPVNEAIATPMTIPDSSAQTTDAGTTTDSATTDGATTDGTADASSTDTASSAGADDTSLLAALIYCEAGNQSYDGMVAVGAVVMNRVNSPSFPNSISEVIYQGGQFTPASSGALASALANGVPSACQDAAVAALNGENPVGDALYFNTGSGKGTKLGDHQFY